MATTQKGRAPANRRRKKKKSNDLLYIAIGIIILAVVLIAIVIALSVNNGNGDGDLNSDISSDISNESESSNPDTSNDSSDTSTQNPDNSNGETSTTLPALNGLKVENGKTYYYQDGEMCFGFNTVNGVEYYFGEDGAMLQSCFKTIDDKTYYFTSDGTKAVGKLEIDGENHYFDIRGVEFALANPWNAVCTETQECDVDLVVLPNGYGDANKGKVDRSIYNDLIAMMDDCYHTTGKDVYVISGHRTYNYQANNYRRQVQLFLNEGHSQHDAEILAAEWVAVPGTSEHHLGLAVDIIDTQIWDLVEEQEDLEGQQWLMENCWKYGFILRYPKNTKSETGINYEPWHYRYLGKELAKDVHDSGLTLEEYIESITK